MTLKNQYIHIFLCINIYINLYKHLFIKAHALNARVRFQADSAVLALAPLPTATPLVLAQPLDGEAASAHDSSATSQQQPNVGGDCTKKTSGRPLWSLSAIRQKSPHGLPGKVFPDNLDKGQS